jgi:hypothetical protein
MNFGVAAKVPFKVIIDSVPHWAGISKPVGGKFISL